MRTLLQPILNYLKDLWHGLSDGWDRFWFMPVDPTTLAMVRILTGTLVFYIHITTTGEVLNLIGPEGWIDAQAISEYRQSGSEYEALPDRYLHTWFAGSIWFYIQDPLWILAVQGIFLAATVCFTLGLCSRVSNVLVWIGHISYLQRGYVTWFGMDSVLCMLLLYLMFGPTGATLSLDRLIDRYRQARRGLSLPGSRTALDLALKPRWSANVVLRMMQLHMCIIYLFAGLSKLQGNLWWNGTAAWYTMMVPELEIVSMRWLGHAPEAVYVIIVLGATYFTLVFECTFIVLVWNRLLRPLVLLGAVGLHGGIGLFMGLGGFGVAMLTGCLAFVSPTSLSWLIGVLFKGPEGLRYVYDRQQPAHLKAASWITAADPYRQVTLTAAPDRTGVPAGTLVTKDGRRLSGFEAFLHLLGVLRCFWFVAPAAIWSFQRSPEP